MKYLTFADFAILIALWWACSIFSNGLDWLWQYQYEKSMTHFYEEKE